MLVKLIFSTQLTRNCLAGSSESFSQKYYLTHLKGEDGTYTVIPGEKGKKKRKRKILLVHTILRPKFKTANKKKNSYTSFFW